MDILSHTLSGLALGLTIAAFAKQDIKSRIAITGFGTLAGALPDIDVISMWSGFDASVGRIFGLGERGADIYFKDYWYSHHGFMHSLIAPLLIILLSLSLANLFKYKFSKQIFVGINQSIHRSKWVLLSFILAYWVHLFEDMPTPHCTWGGVNLFWPSNVYIGGTGKIWWWNNYDIFLIICSVLILNGILLFVLKKRKWILLIVFGMGILFSTRQMGARAFDFNYTDFEVNYSEYEMKSKEEQQNILGEKLYNAMEKFDNKTSLNF